MAPAAADTIKLIAIDGYSCARDVGEGVSRSFLHSRGRQAPGPRPGNHTIEWQEAYGGTIVQTPRACLEGPEARALAISASSPTVFFIIRTPCRPQAIAFVTPFHPRPMRAIVAKGGRRKLQKEFPRRWAAELDAPENQGLSGDRAWCSTPIRFLQHRNRSRRWDDFETAKKVGGVAGLQTSVYLEGLGRPPAFAAVLTDFLQHAAKQGVVDQGDALARKAAIDLQGQRGRTLHAEGRSRRRETHKTITINKDVWERPAGRGADGHPGKSRSTTANHVRRGSRWGRAAASVEKFEAAGRYGWLNCPAEGNGRPWAGVHAPNIARRVG